MGGGVSSFRSKCSFRTSDAVNIETNGAGAAAFSTFGRPLASSRSTRHITPSDFKSKFACYLDRLNGGSARRADIVHDHDARTFFSKALDALARPMLLFSFADEKAVDFSASHSNRYDNWIGSHGQAADGLRTPSALPNFIEKHLASELRTTGVQSRGAAVYVVVARAARRELELPQAKRLSCQQTQQFLTGGRHGKSKIP